MMKNIYSYLGYYFLSIHDSFTVNFTNVTEFITIASEAFNEGIFKEDLWNDKNCKKTPYFSIFIFFINSTFDIYLAFTNRIACSFFLCKI